MDFVRPFDSIFGTRGSLAVIRALIDLPPGLSVSARDLARRAGVSHPTVLSVVENLHTQGMIRARREPKRDSYSLNKDHLLARKLSELFEWESSLHRELTRVIKTEVKKIIPGVQLAVLFGSSVANGLIATSDIDLFLLVPKTDDLESREMQLQDAIQDRFGNRLSVITESVTRNEFIERSNRNPLWRRVLNEGQALIGTL